MQLLDSPLNSLSQELQTTLEDIVNQVQLEPNFCIRHQDYQPLEVPDEARENFAKLPPNLQSKYFSQLLQNFLYGIYYNGSLKETLALDKDVDRSQLYQDLENNTFLGVDLDFYDRLHQSNKGQGYFAPGWEIVSSKDDDNLAVQKNGLTLQIKRQAHLNSEQQQAKVGDIVSILLPKNRVQNGFYMAIGNATKHPNSHPDTPSVTVRIYFNLTAEGAIAIMASLTQQLNLLVIPFSFKALYNPSDYQRHDSAVLYFDKSNYPVIKEVLENIYPQKQDYFQPEIPLFTKKLAPGLALAEEPDRKFSSQDSFGTNRCQIIANGLLAAHKFGDNSPNSRMKAIVQQFELLGITLEHSYLNANSEDIYTTLNL